MKLQLIHLSDMHFEKRDDAFSIDIDKMIQAMDSVEKADECVIVISGDLAAEGKNRDYRYVSSLIGAILKKVGTVNYSGKKIEFVCVPGNHDIDFSKFNTTLNEINKSYSEGKIDQLVTEYLCNMNPFFAFASHKTCFADDKVVSKKSIKYGDKEVNFIMINTAPLSLLGGNSQDMGVHYLSDKSLKKIEQLADADINILVMHHSIEWFSSECKERLRKIILKKYSLILTGHEHQTIGETRNTNGYGNIQYIQGNALHGYTTEGNGFCSVCIDMLSNEMVSHSYLWNGFIYVPKKIVGSSIKQCFSADFTLKEEFFNTLSLDNYKRKIDNFYVFPSLTYNLYKENDDVEKVDIETKQDLMNVIDKYEKVFISGERKSGKTLLSKQLFLAYLQQGNIPLLISSLDICKKRIEKTIGLAFSEQYESDNDAFERYNQLEHSRKIVILDDAHLINEKILDTLIKFFEEQCGKIIIISENKIELDIRKQVVDAMVEKQSLNITIKPFLYVKRKKLISNSLRFYSTVLDLEKETNKINELINNQVKYFDLNPEFIINFVDQYEKDYKFRFSSGFNVFNIVYESTIKNRIIENSENIDPTIVMNVLREIAYYMHFEKRSTIGIDEVSNIAGQYGAMYRQKVNIRQFFDAAIKANILVEINNEIRFKDHTLVAYFVAQALNQKYNQEEDIQDKLYYLLRNLCFSINSDIVLFLALITNNPKFINIIVQGAKQHFEGQEELSFDNKNIPFLMDINIPIKNTLPSDDEKRNREKLIDRQEEEVKISDLIELVNEYDYSEEDLLKVENQFMISSKYLEIISKTLPAFCQNMKVAQQDELVELLYKCPNQFLYMLLKDIGDNFEEFCNSLYDDISMLRKEKNIAEVNMESIKFMVEQISAMLVIALYQVVAATCTTEQTITALKAFDVSSNSNYKLQNLMMRARVSEVNSFSKRAQELNKSMDNKIEKSIIKYTVREYLLRNNVEIYGEGQSLIDCFFGRQDKYNIKLEIAKKRVTENDRI